MTPEQEAMLFFVYSVVLGHEIGMLIALIARPVSSVSDGVKKLMRKFRMKHISKD